MNVIFYIVRHGKTQFNRDHLVQGWCDSPLIDEGVRTARETGRALAEVEFARAYTSDRGRARQTMAELLDARATARRGEAPLEVIDGAECPSTPEAARNLALIEEADETDEPRIVDGIAVRADARLREWCYGDLEMHSGELLHQRLVEGYGEDLSFAEQNERLPETADILARLDKSGRAERFADIEARLTSFLQETAQSLVSEGGGNVLVTTHAFTIRTFMYLLDPSRINDPLIILNGSITRIDYDGERFHLCETGVMELPRA